MRERERDRKIGGEWQKRSRTSFRHSRKLLGAAEPITRTPSTAADEATYGYVRTGSPGAKRLLNSPTATVSKLLNTRTTSARVTKTKAIVVFIRARAIPFARSVMSLFDSFADIHPSTTSMSATFSAATSTSLADDDQPEATRFQSSRRAVDMKKGCRLRHTAIAYWKLSSFDRQTIITIYVT